MVGRRSIRRSGPRRHAPTGRRAGHSGSATLVVGVGVRRRRPRRRAPARSSRSTASSARAPRRSPRRSSACAAPTSGTIEIGGQPWHVSGPADARSAPGHRPPARRPQARGRVHGPPGRREPLRAPVGRAGAARRHHRQASRRRLPALARPLAHPLAQRPAAADRRRCRAATSRRCCSAAGWSATSGCSCSSSRPAASTSAPARRSIGRSAR